MNMNSSSIKQIDGEISKIRSRLMVLSHLAIISMENKNGEEYSISIQIRHLQNKINELTRRKRSCSFFQLGS